MSQEIAMVLRRPTALLISTAIVGIVAACGGAATTATPSASVASSSTAGAAIAVDLKEWSITPSSRTAKAGDVTFNIKNSGTVVHEFVVVKTDIKADALPVIGQKIDESALTAVDEVEDIAVGATPTLKVTLAAGHYIVLCNIETHYGLGMRSDFDVT
jgi:uncharacterized cupredoxin-like copper-binding protein